jgi:hypothetical protein
MKRFFMLPVLLCLASVAVLGQGKTEEQAVLKLEEQWVAALVKADTAALEKLYADDLVYTHSSGAVDTKAKYIDSLKTGKTKYESLDRDDIKVRMYGTTAIVTCHAIFKVNNNTINLRYVHIYVKEKGAWKMVMHQATRLAA